MNAELPRWPDLLDSAVLAHWLGQIAAETGDLNRVEENLNYSEQRLAAVWPHRFATPRRRSGEPMEAYAVRAAEVAARRKRCARNPHALANYVYADRLGNGPEESGDGWEFRGRGPCMLTGRTNYVGAMLALDEDLIDHPDLLTVDQRIGVRVAAWFFVAHAPRCLAGARLGDVETVTRGWNGGHTGLAERRAATQRAIGALGLV